MRRWIIGAATVAALLAATVVGPFGAAATAPYVYGCTPATIFNMDRNSLYWVSMTIYNGTASSAHLTHKILAGDGSILARCRPRPHPHGRGHSGWAHPTAGRYRAGD